MKNITAKVLLCVIFVSLTFASHAQVGIRTNNPNRSAALDINSAEKGLLMPRMSAADILYISNPANGLQVFNTDDDTIYVFTNTNNVWKKVQYNNDELPLPASYEIGSDSLCDNTQVQGVYHKGIPLDFTNYISFKVNVTATGSWAMNTNTTNGYGFSGFGEFSSTRTHTIKLKGSGQPMFIQLNDMFIVNSLVGGTSSCSFTVDITPIPACGTPITYDNKTYNTVQIGGQCWMAENLNVGYQNYNTNNQTDNNIHEKYCYDDIGTNCTIYGGLYQWNEMMQYETTEGSKGICPGG